MRLLLLAWNSPIHLSSQNCRARQFLMSAARHSRAPDTVSVMITTFIGRDRLNRLVIPSPGIESPGRLAAICFGRKPIFPSASASACCVVQGCQLLDDPALMLCPCATPPEVGVPAMTSSLRFFAWCESPVARATYPRFTLVQFRVIRRGDLLHAAFRYPLIEPRTTGPVLLHLQTGNAHGIFLTLRSIPSPAGPGV
jgi:hypothetical protein